MRHDAHGWWMLEAGGIPPAQPPLAGDIDADVVIVGGGYTGMWAAWEVLEREPNARVVLLEAEVCGTFSTPVERKYYVANIFKRAHGQGHIRRIVGLGELQQRFGDAIVNVDLLPVGAMRRNWILTLISDGYVTVRHPDKDTLFAMADAVGTDLQLIAE